MVRVHLLGGVRASTDAGEPLDLGPAKCRAVLAALALSVRDAVPVARLIDVVWGEDPPRTAAKTLQGYIARLRRTLGAETISRVGEAYRLGLDPASVDVARFRGHLRSGNVDEALATWAGPPLLGLEVPGLAATADGLTEQWLAGSPRTASTKTETRPCLML